jgi:hypothetical protein
MLENDEVGGLFEENYVITHLTIQESADKDTHSSKGC